MIRKHESYVAAWRERWREQSRLRLRRAEEARMRLDAIVKHLTDRGARSVFLFGSLAWGGFHAGSDIDIAVEGLPVDASVYRIAAELDPIAAPFRVELVPLEDASEGLREKILHRGERLHASRS